LKEGSRLAPPVLVIVSLSLELLCLNEKKITTTLSCSTQADWLKIDPASRPYYDWIDDKKKSNVISQKAKSKPYRQ
jgi:hypothetical protein